MDKRIIIAGGGTGGHIFPAIAIANAIKQLAPQTKFLFVGAVGKMEMEKVPQAGFEIVGLPIAGFNRSSLIKNIGLPIKLIHSFLKVSSIVKKFKPDAVLGVGGYSTYPVLKYAQLKGIPTFIHEANSYAGKSNQLLGKKATMIFTATDGMEKFFSADKIKVTGNPIRSAIVERSIDKGVALASFGCKKTQTTVLSVGGSLGALSINEAILKHIDLFEQNNLQLIWQTGKGFYNKAKLASSGRSNVYVSDFIVKMEDAYAAADIVISRSGAMSIAELCAVGKPVVFVPFPFAAEDHQKVNAQKLVDKQAALMIEDKNVLEKLVPAIIELSKNKKMQEELINNIQQLKILDADKIVAKEILNHLK